MFLMNPPPVVALQTKWGSFGQSASFRFPVNFSESEEDITGTPINAQVQMIINNLQTDESSLDMNNEYEGIMQKNKNGEKCFDGLPADTRLVKVPSKECVKVDFPVHLEEESTSLGPLVLDSDSDDSVDRDIEEAIQEYLKNKSDIVDSHSTDAESSRTSEDDKCFKRIVAQSCLTPDLMPVSNAKDSEGCNEGNVEICDKLQSASHASDDSDDSFEESIRAEIEQFLIDKKHMETSKAESTVTKKTEPIPKGKPEKNSKGPGTTSTTDKQGCEEFPFGGQKALKTKPQSKCLTSTSIAGPKHCFKENAAVIKTQSTSPILQQKRVQDVPTRQSTKDVVNETSDSSSDDGIEEAIQLFQMEKQKKEGKPVINYSLLLKDQFKVINIANSSTHVPSSKNTASESPKKRNRKRKRANTKSTELNRQSNAITTNFKQLKHSRDSAPPVDKIAKCELSLQTSCRAETATELMCAEAILDISKTIMPSPMEDHDKSLEYSFHSQSILNYSDSDSSALDSDDSIEQEIQTFLALKAQSECVLKSENSTSQNSMSFQLNDPVSHTSPSKKKLSLTHKRRLKEENKGSQPGNKECAEPVIESSQVTDRGELRNRICQSGTGLNSSAKAQDIDYFRKYKQQLVPSEFKPVDEHVEDEMNASSAAFDSGIFRTRNRNSSGDKSSSLDSDEDLDAAIKDLLRSKRKLKKKVKDQKLQCKKKVRFGETEMHVLETFDVIKQKDCSLKSSCTLKSCLLKSRETQENVKIAEGNLEQEKLENVKSDLSLSASDYLQKDSTSISVGTALSKGETFTQQCVADREDSSSVDSDDSIEQEIRKFLAEKARESVSPIHQADSLQMYSPLEKGKENNLSQNNETDPERTVHSSAVTSVRTHQLYDSSKRRECFPSQMSCHDVALETSQENSQSVTEGNRLCGKESVMFNKKEKCSVDHSQRLEGTSVKQTLLSADVSGQSTFPVTFLGNFIAGLQYIPGKERAVFSNGQQVHSVVPCKKEREPNPRSEIPLGLIGKSDITVQKSDVPVGKENETKNKLVTFPLNSLVVEKPGLLKSGNVKENTLVTSPFIQSRLSGHCEGDSLVNKQTHCSVITSHHALPLNVPKEQKCISAEVQRDTLILCRQKVNISNEPESSLTKSDPVVLKPPERELECTYLKYDRKVDQAKEDVDNGTCKLNICVESRSAGEKGMGSNV